MNHIKDCRLCMYSSGESCSSKEPKWISACDQFEEKKWTFSDQISVMSDEELADLLELIRSGSYPEVVCDGEISMLDWLKLEVKNDI